VSLNRSRDYRSCLLSDASPCSHFWLFPGAEADVLDDIMKGERDEEEDTSEPVQEHSIPPSLTSNDSIDIRGTKRAASIEQTSEEGIKIQRHM
jgi:hypothetical protein